MTKYRVIIPPFASVVVEAGSVHDAVQRYKAKHGIQQPHDHPSVDDLGPAGQEPPVETPEA